MADVTGLALEPSVKKKLIAAGFRTAADVGAITATDLAKAASLTPAQALDVCRSVEEASRASRHVFGAPRARRAAPAVENLSAFELMERAPARPIVTFCRALDALLGGGVQLGEITEFCGAPGIGKTQLGIQLSVDAAIPEPYGGVAGSTVYIDTEGSFHVARVSEVASATVKHMELIARSRDERCDTTVEGILGGIHVFRCCSAAELVATAKLLAEFVQAHPSVKLVVLDSVAFHFRHDIQDMASRARILAGLAQTLHELAYRSQLAVVVLNQVTTRVFGNAPSQLVPALGESWSHACTNRIMLHWQGDVRSAQLLKSTSRQEGCAQYCVTASGVRDIDAKRKTPPRRDADSDGDSVPGGSSGSNKYKVARTGAREQGGGSSGAGSGAGAGSIHTRGLALGRGHGSG